MGSYMYVSFRLAPESIWLSIVGQSSLKILQNTIYGWQGDFFWLKCKIRRMSILVFACIEFSGKLLETFGQ